MPTSRLLFDRRALLTGGLAAAGIIALPGPLLAAGSGLDLATGNVELWSRAIGTSFLAQTEIRPLALRLVAVEPLPVERSRPMHLGRGAGFIAVFAMPAGSTPAGDRIYRLAAPGIASFDVYFSAAGDHLRAVFN